MSVITLTICIGLLLISKAIYHTYINPPSLYNASWIICTVCNQILHIKYGALAVKWDVFLYVIVSCILFTFTCCLITRRKRKRIITESKYDTHDYLKYRTIIILNIIAIATNIPILLESIVLLKTSGIYATRMNQVVGTGMAFMLRDLWKNFAIQPIFLATIFIGIDGFIYGSSVHKGKLLILSIIDMIMYTYTYLGRWMILETMLFAIIVYMVRIKQSPLDMSPRAHIILRRIKRVVKAGIIILAVVVIAITRQRTMGNDGSVLYTGTLYFGGSLKYLDLGIREIDQDGYILFGSGLFASIWDNFIIIFQRLLGIDFYRPQEIVYFYNGPIKSLGNGVLFTGFGTVLLNMYLDGRIIGIIVDSVILGVLAMRFYQRLVVWSNVRNRLMAFHSLLIASLVTIQWDGNRLSSMMVFIYFIAMTYNPELYTDNC